MTRMFGRGRYANVTATLALIVALGGTSYAATSLSPDSVGRAQIKRDAVGASEIRRDAVGSSEIRIGAVGNSELKANAVTTSKVALDSLTGSDIQESTLSGLDAAKLGGTDAAAIKDELQPFSFRLADGQSRTIATSGPLTMTAGCNIDDGADDSATVQIATAVNNATVFVGGGPPNADFDIADSPAANTVSDTAGSVAYGPISAMFAAAPDGSQLGTAGALSAGINVHGIANRCYFQGAVFVGATT